MKFEKNLIGKKLKEYRKKAKLTQEEISNKIDIDEKHYGKLERGLFVPSLESFFKLINALDIPLEEFDFTNPKINTTKEKLIKEINLANDNEIEVFYEILNSIKKLK